MFIVRFYASPSPPCRHMHQDKLTDHEKKSEKSVEEKALEHLQEYAEAKEWGLLEASHDVTSDWSRNWCENTGKFEEVSRCEVVFRLIALASESDKYDSMEELVEHVMDKYVEEKQE